jgi:hypothetical protein
MCALENPIPDVGRNLELFYYTKKINEVNNLELFSVFSLTGGLVVICDLVGGQICPKKWLTTETLRTLLLGIDILYMVVPIMIL